MADTLDEFGSETELIPLPAEPESSLDEFISEGEPEALPTAAVLSLEEIVRREMAINWAEAVAVVEEVCALALPADTGVPERSDLSIADGTVVRRNGARVQADVSSAGRLLHSLLSSAGNLPVPLRLFVTQASAPGAYERLTDFAKALAYFAKPGRRELIRALYQRCAMAAAPGTPVVRPPDPKREEAVERTPKPVQPRRSIPKWAMASVAVVILSAAAIWVGPGRWGLAREAPFSSLVAQAREVAGSLGLAAPAEQPPPGVPAVAEVESSGTARPGISTPAPVATRRLASRALEAPDPVRARNRRRASPVVPALIAAPPSAELSSRNADETAREAVALTIYTSKDADVQPPLLLHPQIPANLILAGESRLNVMELLVSETGSVEQVRLIAGPSRLPDVMLLSGAKAWRFQPATRNGEAVRYRAVVSWAGTP